MVAALRLVVRSYDWPGRIVLLDGGFYAESSEAIATRGADLLATVLIEQDRETAVSLERVLASRVRALPGTPT